LNIIIFKKISLAINLRMKGYSDVLVGLQFGDEGKARIIDAIAREYNVVARFNGGPNAGHSVQVGDKKLVLHQVPSGVFHPNHLLYVGSGCVINPEKLVKEIREIEELGISLEKRLFISEQASLIQPVHIIKDLRYCGELGTTGNGIGPAYADQALRVEGKNLRNIQFGAMIHSFRKNRRMIREDYNSFQRKFSLPLIEDSELEAYCSAVAELAKFAAPNTLFLEDLVRNGQKVLFEGAQATMLDKTFGTVPFVTSSHTLASFAYVGGDIPCHYHRKTIGVAKAIMSRVGNGPFVSELGGALSEAYCAEEGGKKYSRKVEMDLDVKQLLSSGNNLDIGIALRILGNEYGATTGRPRRIGILDLVQLSFACRINGVEELYLTKVDCLRDFSRTKFGGIPLVRGYSSEELKCMPTISSELRRCQPITSIQGGFSEDLSALKSFEELPKNATEILNDIECATQCKIQGIGVGPEREQLIIR